MRKYTYFWNGPFSNWAKSPFNYKGVKFSTAEQAMMWEKAMTFADTKTADRILATSNPSEQKALGCQVRGYNDEKWSADRFNIVKGILRHKFTQHLGSRDALRAAKGTILVEASLEDKIWGIGMSAEEACRVQESGWQGLNLLGKALTEICNEFTLSDPTF